MFRVAWFIDGVVACHPGIGLVVCCNLSPEPNASVLVIFVVPEGGVAGGVVGVPVRVLTSRDCVHVKDCVDFVFGALGVLAWWGKRENIRTCYVYHSVEVFESRFL